MSDTAIEATGLAGAADAFTAALGDDLTFGEAPVTPTVKQAKEDASNPREQVDPDEQAAIRAALAAENGEAEPSEHETNPEDQSEGGEEEGAEPSEETEDDPEKLPSHVTVTIDGKPVQVPLDEAVKGYQRQADYSRKTQALAEERKTHAEAVSKFSEEAQAVSAERARYGQLLTLLETRLNELTPQEPNWAELARGDRTEYLIQRDAWNQLQEQKRVIAAERERVESTQTAEQQKSIGARVQAGRKALVEYEPKWADDKVRQAEFADVRKYAQDTLGYTQQELENAVDHRQVIATHKAMKYDQLMAKARALKPVAPSKKVAAPGGAARQASPEKVDAKNAMRRLAQSGHERDAAAVFEQLLF
jgi:hypothetical protein